MQLTGTNWTLLVACLRINLLIGISYHRRASGNTAEFLISRQDVS